uniref:ATP synthase F0 subunit 8 n=1 Tax=Propylea japonica TaxID=158624 RepID=A0A0A0S0T3_9CUCU|nr:ATP synthase F0 subunit 8 [Propylea japonica]UXW88420.1 ATP synthase F0 subunit 8 [Propylea quattuordecimpunctata]
MPQAMPLNWLMLYNMFIIIFILIIIKLYFNKYIMPKNLKNMKNIQNMNNWKW